MSQHPLVSLLGEKVINGAKEEVSVTDLIGDGKCVCLYFSAHWCPPCRSFTPVFAEFYKKIKASDKGNKLETIFVSSDKGEKEFDEYFGEMPWHALPFNDRSRKNKLSKKFKVQGIPSLVVLNGATGQLITSNGRSLITEDPEGNDFPWQQRTFYDIMDGPLINNEGGEIQFSELKGKTIAIYFSAHWCPPCRAFTPDLVKFYEKHHEKLNFELIFASSDKEESQFKEYFGTMPWKAVPLNDKKRLGAMKQMFEVSGIPLLVVVNSEGNLVTKNGRAGVSSDPDGKDFPWAPKPVEKLTSHTASSVNDMPCLIYFTEEEDDAEKAQDVLLPMAQAEQARAKEAGEEVRVCFFTAVPDDDDDVVDSLMSFLKLDSKLPKLVITDIDEQLLYAAPDASHDKIAAFVDDFYNGKLTGQKLKR